MSVVGRLDPADPREVIETVEHFVRAQSKNGVGTYSQADWDRLRTAYQHVEGDSVLDVGVGNGAFLHILARSGRFGRICGVDIRRHSTLQLPAGVDYRLMSAADLQFADDEFDTVVCMEVLEHLESPSFEAALQQLRRVARKRLIMTVPLNEPLPLWWQDKPGGHRQQFTEERLAELFPDAHTLIQPRPGSTDWIFLFENGSALRRQERRRSMQDNDDRILDTYYRRAGSKKIQDEARDRVHWLIAQARGRDVLDVGCSQGLVSILLGRASFNVLGMDIRPEAIEFARQELAREPDDVRTHVRFMAGAFNDLPSNDAEFDTIILAEVLEHQSHPQRLLAEAAARLRPGGRLVMTVPFGFHPDIDHKQTFYLSDFEELVSQSAQILELSVMHRFICCVATIAEDATEPVDSRRLLVDSERVFLELEKAHKSEVDTLRYMYGQAKSEIAARERETEQLTRQLIATEKEVTVFRGRLETLEQQLRQHDVLLGKREAEIEQLEGELELREVEMQRHGQGIAVRATSALVRRLLPSAERHQERRARRRAALAKMHAAASTSARERRNASLLHRTERPKLPVKIACILDEFSYENFRHDCELHPLPVRGWKEALERTRPDLLLVESAWAGNDGAWQYKITYERPRPDNPLFELLAYCRQTGIKTAFWNKEDPPNYERFIDAARRFDHIFTTCATCVDRYRVDAPDSQVHVLPFAAQPSVQNPVDIEAFEKLSDVCFAGAWYPRHPERHEDAKNLLEASRHRSLVIYDRYFDHPSHDKHLFPPEYQPFIRGSLSFEEMLEKYRQHRVFLNVNSVKDSPTMFSRRVLELLACGTPVVSGYARGIEELLGADVVPLCRSADEARAALDRILNDPFHRDALVLKGQREIFSKHTYRHRVRQICDALGVSLPEEQEHVTVITATIRRTFVDNLLENFHRQSYPHKELIVVVNEGRELDEGYVHERARALGVTEYRVLVAPEDTTLGACLNLGVEAATGSIFAKMDDDDHYGEHYLLDSVLALQYSGAACVGKESYFTYAEGANAMYLQVPGRHHRMTKFVIGTTLVARKEIFPEVSFGDLRVGEDSAFLRRLAEVGLALYSHSPYNYVKYYAKSLTHHTWKVDQAQYLKNAELVCEGNDPSICCF